MVIVIMVWVKVRRCSDFISLYCMFTKDPKKDYLVTDAFAMTHVNS